MICYKDMTFCKEKTCRFFNDECHRALTPDRLEAAKKWWGSGAVPIAVFDKRPSCFHEDENVSK
jgi:hypothetical protein